VIVLTKEQLNQFAERAGFGGNQRNTYRVKLELFAKMVEAAVLERQLETKEQQ
jgi:hypothetical protein